MQSYFNNAPHISSNINVSRETFGLWYAILAKYLEKEPDEKSTRAFISKQPALALNADEIMKSIDRLEKNKKAAEILKKVKEEIV